MGDSASEKADGAAEGALHLESFPASSSRAFPTGCGAGGANIIATLGAAVGMQARDRGPSWCVITQQLTSCGGGGESGVAG
jgi:hypothetical protein